MSTDVYEHDVTSFEDAQQSEADKRLMPIFFRAAIQNEAKSIEAGRPIFDEIDQVKIMTPGSKDTFVTDATPEYQARFPIQWARYKAKMDQSTAGGTPLNMLPWLSIGQIAEFNAVNVYTVEQLAGMSDAMSQKFMGHHQLKQRAQAYIDNATSAAPLLKVQKELQTRDEQIAELKRINEGLMTRLGALEKNSQPNQVPLKA